ncbi:hypothetical protein T440DRAFT_37141 [Plenodomus tracheiphilus IPT5]|uniref:C2H2-type domain-containing protein n=1 Tax=Plenodomus tracheiphilus IPT5 TaxID=1408161 RepID=A0A6A7BBS2_9PLEO|nr:hypothetical protein T440DRAFT_37141 [Plenodomus tracheiphilus IPT5]
MAYLQNEYFDDNDYHPVQERLVSQRPIMNPSPSPTLGACQPLWLEQDINDSPLAPSYIEHQDDGLDGRSRLYRQHLDLTAEYELFLDTLLLHQMSLRHGSMHLESRPMAGKQDLKPGSHGDGKIESPISSPKTPGRVATAKSRYPRKGPKKTRLGLPITIDVNGNAATVLACADTGADVNIISDDLAHMLGFQPYDSVSEKKNFALANGKIVEAVGQITSSCTFGVEALNPHSMTCVFYVLLHVATPVIMGMEFLDKTKTMTHHRDRLVQVPRPSYQALSVCSVGRPRQLLACALNQKDVFVTPDTGSEIDLVSPSFAHEEGLQIYHGEELIELADGSIEVTSGLIEVNLTVRHSPNQQGESHVIAEAFILEGLQHDMIVGEDTLDTLEVFTNNFHALISASDVRQSYEINRIRCRGTLEKMWKWIATRIGNKKADLMTTSGGSSTGSLSDQRELDRREQEARRIATLPARDQDAAITAEVLVQQQYHSTTSTAIPRDDLAGGMRSFECDYPLCNAQPFATQYLLNKHTMVHSQTKSHYCPVKYCPRGEGGKGFRRKNELRRHGLVHRPGYICPFCPDTEYEYPGPDNLQRHVRVHHLNKDAKDPKLLRVLEQRPEGGRRGCRRRGT